MKKLASIIVLMLPLVVYSQSLSRQVVASGGAFESSSNMTLSYTVGEPVIETFSQSSLILTQGFQQTNLDPTVGIEEQEATNLKIIAYPNPTSNQVILELEASNEQEVSAQVFDFQGKMIESPVERQASQEGRKFQIDLTGYAPGTYMLSLVNSQGERLYTTKVQKVY